MDELDEILEEMDDDSSSGPTPPKLGRHQSPKVVYSVIVNLTVIFYWINSDQKAATVQFVPLQKLHLKQSR